MLDRPVKPDDDGSKCGTIADTSSLSRGVFRPSFARKSLAP
jgi:hypothetical protein